MRDKRLERADELVMQAWKLTGDLRDLLQQLPNESRGYAECMRGLHDAVDGELRRMDQAGLFRLPRIIHEGPQADAIARTGAVFQEAYRRLAEFGALRLELPDPNISADSRLPADWSELHACAVSVLRVQTALTFGLLTATQGASIRNEFDVLKNITRQ